jgi:hypothetical protein
MTEEYFDTVADCSGTPTSTDGPESPTVTVTGGATSGANLPAALAVIGYSFGFTPHVFPFVAADDEVDVLSFYRDCDGNKWHLIAYHVDPGDFLAQMPCEFEVISGTDNYDIDLGGDCTGADVEFTCCTDISDPDGPKSIKRTVRFTITNNWYAQGCEE